MKNITLLQNLVRIIGTIQIIAGIVFWTGNAEALVPMHIILGTILTLVLFVLAFLAYRAKVSSGLVLVAVLWGIGLPLWGMAQDNIFPGAYHWITQVLHLLCGLGAMGLAEILAVKIRAKKS